MPYGTLNADTITNSNGLSGNAIGPGFKNRIINGGMVIDQRNAGASVTPTNGQYLTDRWQSGLTQASKFTAQQNQGGVTPPAGFTNYLGVTSSSSYSVLSSDIFAVNQWIEGYNIADLNFGTANAKTVTLSFWVRSSLTGSFGGALAGYNLTSFRSYPFPYTISAANTWEQKTITIQGDTTTFAYGTTNGYGIAVIFNLGAGATNSGTANTWQSGLFYAPTGSTSVVGTNGATFYITGVQLEVGPSATSFDYRPYGTELMLCQRYYYRVTRSVNVQSFGNIFSYSTNNITYGVFPFPVTMRTAPTALEQTGTASNYAIAFAGAGTVCTSVPAFTSGTNENNAITSFTATSGHTAGQAGYAYANASGAYLGWSAEL